MKTGDNALSFYMIISDLEEHYGSPYCSAFRCLTCVSTLLSLYIQAVNS